MVVQNSWHIVRPKTSSLEKAKAFIFMCSKAASLIPQTFREWYAMSKVVAALEAFTLEGICKEQEWLYKNQEQLERYLLENIRNNGYVPVLDLGPVIKSLDYDAAEEQFSYVLEILAYKCTAKAHILEGILVGEAVVLTSNGEAYSIAAL